MANISFLRKTSAITDDLEKKVSRARDVRAYLNTTVVRQYVQAQMNRWQSENQSEGAQWAPLSLPYAKLKKKKYASYKGGGNVPMVATGRLVDAATLADSTTSYKLVSQTGIRIGINDSALPYAKYVGEKRPFMSFSAATLSDMRAGLKAYIAKGTFSWRAS